MLKDKTIAFIGAGTMAEALIRGLLASSSLSPSSIGASHPSQERLDWLIETYGIRAELDNRSLASGADIVVLAVKPQILPLVLAELRAGANPNTLYLSVVAGVTSARIEEGLGGDVRVVRSMPNTPALVGAGATALSAGRSASDEDVELCRELFAAVGITERVDESKLDAVTGLSGGGPAYIFVVLEAMADAGVKMGLTRECALRLSAQTVMGAAKLLLDTDGHPAKLKDMVTSPGGTTIAGVHALEAGGLRTTIINAVEAATRRSKELGSP